MIQTEITKSVFWDNEASDWTTNELHPVRNREVFKHGLGYAIGNTTRAVLNGHIENSNSLILDLGSGGGFQKHYVGDVEAQVLAIDISHDMLSQNSARHKIQFDLSSSTLPLRDESVDGAVSYFLMRYLEDGYEFCKEISRVLKPGARAVLIDYGKIPVMPQKAIVSEELFGEIGQRLLQEHLITGWNAKKIFEDKAVGNQELMVYDFSCYALELEK